MLRKLKNSFLPSGNPFQEIVNISPRPNIPHEIRDRAAVKLPPPEITIAAKDVSKRNNKAALLPEFPNDPICAYVDKSREKASQRIAGKKNSRCDRREVATGKKKSASGNQRRRGFKSRGGSSLRKKKFGSGAKESGSCEDGAEGEHQSVGELYEQLKVAQANLLQKFRSFAEEKEVEVSRCSISVEMPIRLPESSLAFFKQRMRETLDDGLRCLLDKLKQDMAGELPSRWAIQRSLKQTRQKYIPQMYEIVDDMCILNDSGNSDVQIVAMQKEIQEAKRAVKESHEKFNEFLKKQKVLEKNNRNENSNIAGDD